jgi:ubiquinone biosynthesis protein Coq4
MNLLEFALKKEDKNPLLEVDEFRLFALVDFANFLLSEHRNIQDFSSDLIETIGSQITHNEKNQQIIKHLCRINESKRRIKEKIVVVANCIPSSIPYIERTEILDDLPF